MEHFIVDCIMANWDVFNNNNIGIHNKKVIRTDVGGALYYRGRGDRKYDFNLDVPTEHISKSKVFHNK